jgi:branched-chain amino acid transport system permease protein
VLPSLILAGLAVGSIYALVGLALVLVNKATGVINFAQGEMAMFGAFVMLSVIRLTGWPLPVVFCLGVIGGVLMGWLTERLFIRPLLSAPPLNLLITTIGLWFVFNGAAGWIWGYDPFKFPSLLSQMPVDFAGVRITPASLAIILVALALMAALYVFFEFTREGTAMRAASEKPRAAALMGIRMRRVTAISWAFAGGISVAAGMLIAPITFLDPNMMAPILLKGFAGAIMGGFASLPGTVLGGLILGVVETLLGAYVSASFKEAFAFLLIIAVLMARPTGVFGSGGRKKV